jgi:hypothetical protein
VGNYAGVVKFLLVVVVLGVAVYLVVRLLQRRGLPSFRRGATTRPAPPKAKPTQPRRPVAPDDDADFLRDLDRKKRHRHQDDPDA